MVLAQFPAVRAAIVAAGLILLAACDSPPHAAPAFPTAEASEGQVSLSWNAVTGVRSYVIQWSDNTGGSGEVKDVTTTSYVHTGLTNLRTYTYRVIGQTSGGRGPSSVPVQATPGPVPGPVEWATVVTAGADHVIHFATAAQANLYRIYAASSPINLVGRRPNSSFVEATTSPYTRTAVGILNPVYYRVIAMNDSRIGTDGPVVISSTHSITRIDIPLAGLAVNDRNADSCLDLVAATSNCQGLLTATDMTVAGLTGIFAAGRTTGDSRMADFNGDGRPDIFSTTLSLATDPLSQAILHLNQAANTFVTDAGVTALGIGGFAGTAMAADYDNDGDIDLFAPYDTSLGDGAQNWLLLNNGTGSFTDGSAAAGLTTNPAGANFVPRGGQAADFNGDGRIDLLFGSRLLLNDGGGLFSDGSVAAALPVRADEGMKFIDVDLDGDLDLIHHDGAVTRLYRNASGVFDSGAIVDQDASQSTFGYGLNVCDVNSDGFEDVLVAHNVTATGVGVPHLLLNVNGQLLRSSLPGTLLVADDLLSHNDLLACGDFDGNGVADIIARWGTTHTQMRAALALSATIKLRVLGSTGARNQQGRIVRLVPRSATNRVITRVVESGSGLHAQNQYDLLVGAPWLGTYDITVRFGSSTVMATAVPGDSLTIYADGRVVTGLQ